MVFIHKASKQASKIWAGRDWARNGVGRSIRSSETAWIGRWEGNELRIWDGKRSFFSLHISFRHSVMACVVVVVPPLIPSSSK